MFPGQRLGDPYHEPPVDDDPGGGRDGEHHLALDLAEGHQDELRVVLPLGQHPDEGAGFGLRDRRQVRHAVEVHEDDAASALHHPPGRDRGIDPARQQRGHRTARAHR